MKHGYGTAVVIWTVICIHGLTQAAEKDVTQLQVGVKYRPTDCNKQAENGDTVSVHYKGSLTDGTVFDSSYDRNEPIEFELGSGGVIEGWEKGLLGACIGEKRKLKIPSHMGYGDIGMPPIIPGKATLIFEVVLVDIKHKAS